MSNIGLRELLVMAVIGLIVIAVPVVIVVAIVLRTRKKR